MDRPLLVFKLSSEGSEVDQIKRVKAGGAGEKGGRRKVKTGGMFLPKTVRVEVLRQEVNSKNQAIYNK